jgi:hypothetical protein
VVAGCNNEVDEDDVRRFWSDSLLLIEMTAGRAFGALKETGVATLQICAWTISTSLSSSSSSPSESALSVSGDLVICTGEVVKGIDGPFVSIGVSINIE